MHGLKLNRQLANTKPLANKIKYELIDTTIPHPPESDEYLVYDRVGGTLPRQWHLGVLISMRCRSSAFHRGWQ